MYRNVFLFESRIGQFNHWPGTATPCCTKTMISIISAVYSKGVYEVCFWRVPLFKLFGMLQCSVVTHYSGAMPQYQGKQAMLRRKPKSS